MTSFLWSVGGSLFCHCVRQPARSTFLISIQALGIGMARWPQGHLGQGPEIKTCPLLVELLVHLLISPPPRACLQQHNGQTPCSQAF